MIKIYGEGEEFPSPKCLPNLVGSSVMEMLNNRRSNGLTAIVASKAVSSPLCILIGLIFGQSFFVVYGAILGLFGLYALVITILLRGFSSTIQSFRTLFQEFSRDFKATLGKIRIRQQQKKTIFSLKLTEEGVFRVFEMPDAPDFFRKTTDFFLSYNEWPKKGVPLLVESINPEMENDQLKAVTIELGTISVWRVLVFRIRYFAWRIVEAIRNINRKDC